MIIKLISAIALTFSTGMLGFLAGYTGFVTWKSDNQSERTLLGATAGLLISALIGIILKIYHL